MKETASIAFSLADNSIFRACVEGSADAIMLTDLAGSILYVNSTWEKIYGYGKRDALGKTPRLLRSGRHDSDFYARLWADILDPARGFWRGEVVNRAKDGHDVVVQLTISPFCDREGVTQGYMSVATDLTERKRLEAKLRGQDRLATIGLLADGLAHEIGTPLGVARGRAEYLLGEASSDPSLRKSLAVVIGQIDRVSKLISALLHVTRQEGANDVAPVTVRPLVESVARLLGGKISARGASFDIRIPEDTRVLAEPSRLRQVFLHLCLNAVQSIESTADRPGPHGIQISARETGDAWVVSVRDSGAGLSVETMARLFTPFFTTKEVGVGTGLGLATSQQYVHAWGGSIWADGPSTDGACFHLRLPKYTDTERKKPWKKLSSTNVL